MRTLAYPSAPSREEYLEAVKSSRKAHNTRVDSEARWETLVLDAGVLERLKLTCLLVRDAETWRAQGVTVPRSLLLTGPPGVGKTEIGRTLANESGLGFLAATTADGRSYLVGATVPLSEFQRVYKSSLNEWQRMAFEGCVADAGSHIDETSLDPSHRQARRIRRVRAATSLPQW